MTLVLDTGALIALERNDRPMWRRLKAALQQELIPVTHGGVVGQAWRGRGPRETLLVKALAAIDVRPLDEALGRRAGELLGAAKRRDVIDAALVLLARDGDHIVTSDPDDIEPLAEVSGRHVEIVLA
jgi:predicted nucleic acid-binding protein